MRCAPLVTSGNLLPTNHEKPNEMPDMQRLDEGAAHPRDAPQEGVCEPAPLHDARVRHFPNNPFLYTCEDGRWYVNRAKRRSKADEAQTLGDAKW